MQRAKCRITTIAGAGLVALLLTGCGDSGQTGKNASGDKPKATRAASPATPLRLDTSARQVKYTDTEEKAFDLKVAPVSLTRGTDTDVADVRLEDGMKGMVPHYLTVSVANSGTATFDAGTAPSRFALVLADGFRGQRMSFFHTNPLGKPGTGPLETCTGTNAPTNLAAGQTALECQVVMLPKDAKPATVSYRDDSGTQIWKVEGGDADDSGILPAGRPAEATWTGSDGKGFPLTVTPKSVRKVGIDALAGYDLDAGEKDADLYFVTFEYRNKGTTELAPSMDDAVVLRTEAGQRVSQMLLISIGGAKPEGCASRVPDGMVQPGRTVQQCGVYLVDKGDKPVTVNFTPKRAKPLAWRVS
ncbi:hypothetical protein [Streptomyces candidus]|uniref:Lipoprotein n=1 Tax=Streptomyces candidus TaxID=67283 RepID=A0A7X0LSA0_9ACTN|nr:hypothetical protein [Streptomyces candidus]MBB6439483.1 hypothetical protein [Streptomyces candidus]GHH56494.1 hypothetical protein GCM10018773_62510 [Streptomyces candidus]